MVETTRTSTFVLVPGAWMGAWSWHPVAQVLRERGHDVVALTMPGLSYGSSPVGLRLADAVDFVAGEIEDRELRDVVLVAHSWGGYPVSGAALKVPERIAKVVYHNAVVPAVGVAMSDENAEYGQLIHAAVAASPDRTVPIPVEAVRAGLMRNEPAALQELVHRLTVPQPGAYMTDALDAADVTKAGLAAGYVLGADDVALARPGAEFAARIGIEPVVIPGGHMAMLSRPAEVAQALFDQA